MFENLMDKVYKEVEKVIVGQREVVKLLLLSIFCKGHSLITGVPGLAKTLIVKTLARTLDLEFKRIQFTPDLMPSDVTGTEVIYENKLSGEKEFRFVKGPVFTNILLADEINRTPPKTQSALLEAMAERQVSTGGKVWHLDEIFCVYATQNPLEQEGTYPLPEAQLDRFLFSIDIYYPSQKEEEKIVLENAGLKEVEILPVIKKSDILEIQKEIFELPVSDKISEFCVFTGRQTRPDFTQIKEVKDYVEWGVSTRGIQLWVMAAKGLSYLKGKNYVDYDSLKELFYPVFNHRIILNLNALSDGVRKEELLSKVWEYVKKKF